jgi:hypothetical protein
MERDAQEREKNSASFFNFQLKRKAVGVERGFLRGVGSTPAHFVAKFDYQGFLKKMFLKEFFFQTHTTDSKLRQQH